MEGAKEQNSLLAAEKVLPMSMSGHCVVPTECGLIPLSLGTPLFLPFIFWGMNDALAIILGHLTFGS